tara:strand:+ start:68 stop:490 length:423 start_codon:yes stop_codon:yes gene_type:complete
VLPLKGLFNHQRAALIKINQLQIATTIQDLVQQNRIITIVTADQTLLNPLQIATTIQGLAQQNRIITIVTADQTLLNLLQDLRIRVIKVVLQAVVITIPSRSRVALILNQVLEIADHRLRQEAVVRVIKNRVQQVDQDNI